VAIANYLRQDHAVTSRTPTEVGALIRARREARGLRQEGIDGVSSALVGRIERGTAPVDGRGLTRSAFAQALGWPPDAFERLADGEDPAVLDAPPPEEAAPPTDPNADLVAAVRELTAVVRDLRARLKDQDEP
jgi:transcriptional regulator with XRE-family HTH domain